MKLGTFDIKIGCPLFLIAGPCVLESETLAFETAKRLLDICQRLNIFYIFKSSYDKANRSSVNSFRGPGREKGLEILAKLKSELKVPVLTDVHSSEDAAIVAQVADILQIPAFLCRQTDLLTACGETRKFINIKKGQFMAPWEMANAAEKVMKSGGSPLLTERGATFGYNNLVVDMRSIPIMKQYGYPVIFDATHSVQQPGGLGNCSGGDRTMAPYLAKAAVATGIEGLFLETHPEPDKAMSDGPNMIPLDQIEKLLLVLVQIDSIVKKAD